MFFILTTTITTLLGKNRFGISFKYFQFLKYFKFIYLIFVTIKHFIVYELCSSMIEILVLFFVYIFDPATKININLKGSYFGFDF